MQQLGQMIYQAPRQTKFWCQSFKYEPEVEIFWEMTRYDESEIVFGKSHSKREYFNGKYYQFKEIAPGRFQRYETVDGGTFSREPTGEIVSRISSPPSGY